jgi:hypothetical protein
MFFATKNDIIPVIRLAESAIKLKYTLTGLHFAPEVIYLSSAMEIPTLGVATKENAINGASYLVLRDEDEVVVHERPQVRGGIRYEVSQFGNPRTITFQHGGTFEDKILLYGRIGTVSIDPVSMDLYRLFCGGVRKHFRKIRSYYVGPEADSCLENGWRLTISAQSPREFDLVGSDRGGR